MPKTMPAVAMPKYNGACLQLLQIYCLRFKVEGLNCFKHLIVNNICHFKSRNLLPMTVYKCLGIVTVRTNKIISTDCQ